MVRLQQDRSRYHLIRILYVPLSILSSNTAAKHITAFDVIYSIVCIRETFVFLVHPHKQARAPVKMAPGLGRSHMYSRPGEKVIWNIFGTIFFSPNNFARTALQLYLAFYGFCSAVLCCADPFWIERRGNRCGNIAAMVMAQNGNTILGSFLAQKTGRLILLIYKKWLSKAHKDSLTGMTHRKIMDRVQL